MAILLHKQATSINHFDPECTFKYFGGTLQFRLFDYKCHIPTPVISKKTWNEGGTIWNNDEWKTMQTKFKHIFSNIHILFWLLWNIIFCHNIIWWSTYQFHFIFGMWYSWYLSLCVTTRPYWSKSYTHHVRTCFGDQLHGWNIFTILSIVSYSANNLLNGWPTSCRSSHQNVSNIYDRSISYTDPKYCSIYRYG